MNNRRDLSRLFVFLDIIEGYFLEKCSFLFCFMLFVRSIALYFNKIEIIIKLVG